MARNTFCSLLLLGLVFIGNSEACVGSKDDSNFVITSGALVVNVTSGPFSFTLSVDSEVWLNSYDVLFSADGKSFRVQDGSLTLIATSAKNGTDEYGQYDELEMQWKRTEGIGAEWMTGIRSYDVRYRSALVFKSQWLKGNTGIVAGSQFPSLVPDPSAPELGSLEYTGTSCGFMVRGKNNLKIEGGEANGMILISPKVAAGETSVNATLALGPVKEHFANQAAFTNGGISYGLAPSFTFAPAGYTLETVLVASAKSQGSVATPERASVPVGGTNAVLFEYGDFVLQRNNKTRAGPAHTQEVEYLGYSTTGFYFYNLCDCLDEVPNIYARTTCNKSPIPGCKSYEDTLLAVNKALKEQGIPFKHFLLDSWWYGENLHAGVSTWEDNENVRNVSFPTSLADFWKQVGQEKSIWAHNGKWSNTPYAEKYEFYGGSSGMPQGSELWDYLFSRNREWGLNTIKQDHMGQQMRGTQGAYSNVTVLKSWVTGMGEGATKNGVGVLYCCAPPSVHMNGVTVPAAYSVRASPDYVWQAGGRVLKLPQIQWAIGPDSAFHWSALGLLPYKDTFFSNSSATPQAGTWTNDTSQWAPFTGFHEAHPVTHALMSTLSMAQVTFTDGVGMANKTLLSMITRSDGKVLKPDRPSTAIDGEFYAMMFGDWPSLQPKPSPGHGTVTMESCNGVDAQKWYMDVNGTFFVDDNTIECLDLSKCNMDSGAVVQMFSDPSGCGKPPGTCDGKNELWHINCTRCAQETVSIKSEYSNHCLRVDYNSATAVVCDPEDINQAWVAIPTQDEDSGEVAWQFTRDDRKECLTAGPITPIADCKRTSLPVAQPAPHYEWLSENYGASIQISLDYMTKKEEQCLTSPQSPVGEVYTTHTTIGNATWRYVVAVQLSADYKLLAESLAISDDAHRVFPWNEASLFISTEAPSMFSPTAPLLLKDIPVSPDTGLYPLQYFNVAPLLEGNWYLIGEVNKLVPVSNQRIQSVESNTTSLRVTIEGDVGEAVHFGAYNGALNNNQPMYAECSLPASIVVLEFPSGTCKAT